MRYSSTRYRAAFLLGLGLLLACDSKTPRADPELPDPPCGTRDGMVGLKRLDTGECFWMDARPVSRKEFYDAVQAGMPLSDDTACAEHERHAPHLGPNRSEECYRIQDIRGCGLQEGAPYLPWPPASIVNYLPMYCARWCDAHTYCQFVGKRLCRAADVGKIEPLSASADELRAACVADGDHRGLTQGASCSCRSRLDECQTIEGPRWSCVLEQCAGPYEGMNCLRQHHIYVHSDQPAMESMGWDGETLDCDLGSLAVVDASKREIDDASIVCCAD